MKRKLPIIIAIVLLLVVGAFCAFLIYDAYKTEETPTGEMPDISEQIKTYEETAFAFLNESENILPDDMRGYIVDPSADMNFADTSEDALKKSAENVFEKVDAILPNTVVIKFSEKINYAPNGFDVLSYLVDRAKEQELYVIFLLDGKETDKDKILEKTIKYNMDAVMIHTGNSDISQKVKNIKEHLNSKDIKFGVYCEDAPNDNIIKNINSADFCFVQINHSSENGGENIIKQWAQIALANNNFVYGVIRNDLVKSGAGWTQSNEVNNLVKLLYNHGGFSGCVMYSHAKLRTDDNDTATNLYSYYEYFNNVDYTALTFTDVEIKNNAEIIFSGTTDKDYPTHVWCTENGKWQSIPTQGEDGKFTANIPLALGENKVVVKHKNARYTYYIDRAVDVLTEYQAVVADGVVTLTAKAVKGAQVFASLANTVPIQMKATETEENGYVTYTATYELNDWLAPLTAEQVSFAATYRGIDDIVMCGKTKEITPYDNHNLGTATVCRVEKNYSETTSTASEDDTSDPTCTPQLAGSYGYVEEVTVCDNHVLLYLTSGMKLHCDNTRLIVGGYVMPDNSVKLESIEHSDGTTLTFSSSYDTFIKMILAPQNYYTGYLERIYNVDSFEAEYVDIIFMDTAQCSYTAEPDFTLSDVVSKAEWYANDEEDFMILRLYLKNKGDFGGYSYEKAENGQIKITLRKKAASLEGTVIMLDPGHGGYGSPGTNSNMKIYEKDVVFAIAEKTAQILREHGATVIMTRSGDEALFLNERVKMTRDCDPDVFVSIHSDGSDSKSLYGTHTFYYRSFSMPLADAIHKQIVNAYRTYYYNDPASKEYEKVDMDIKFFPYMVTRVEECPSVLVECGYLTNENDARFLTDPNGQAVLATAIAQGIVDFLAG